jgi:hypothetical protein
VARIDWLQGIFFKKFGNGSSILFWSVVWVGTVPLKDIYQRLFRTKQKEPDSRCGEVGGVELGLGFKVEEESFCVGRGVESKLGNYVESSPIFIFN